MPYRSISSAAAVAAGHTTMPARTVPQRRPSNRHEMRVSGSDSYALLCLLIQRSWILICMTSVVVSGSNLRSRYNKCSDRHDHTVYLSCKTSRWDWKILQYVAKVISTLTKSCTLWSKIDFALMITAITLSALSTNVHNVWQTYR